MRFLFALALGLFVSSAVSAQPIDEYMDLQLHPCMHMAYKFFEPGLTFFDEANPPKLSHKHLLNNICYANYFKGNKGARILAVGALTQENIGSPRKARKLIMSQIEYVNKFVAENSEHFAVGRSPQEVRDLVHNTDKTIFVHCIEGGRNLVNSQADAQFWADQGVAFITLIHLVDWKYGGSGIRPGFPTHLLNFWAHFRREEKRGLKERGKQAILWLANAGVMTDITHMSDQARKDALAFMEMHNIPPISTHDFFKPIHNQPRGMEEEDVLKVYRNNGFVSLAASGIACRAYKPRADYKAKIDSLESYCNGSIDSYKFTYLAVKDYIESNLASIYGDSVKLEDMTEAQKVNLSIGFQTDFNGWLDHHLPRYGPEGCYTAHPDSTYEAVDIQGLAHPGLLESHWRVLEKEGVDLAPVRRSSEKFMQLWEQFLYNRGRFGEHY
jgi:microsomal dipeptidase-like Zn-dependent dipeptidase